eukprot:4584396-Amphidinium_carterae.1
MLAYSSMIQWLRTQSKRCRRAEFARQLAHSQNVHDSLHLQKGMIESALPGARECSDRDSDGKVAKPEIKAAWPSLRDTTLPFVDPTWVALGIVCFPFYSSLCPDSLSCRSILWISGGACSGGSFPCSACTPKGLFTLLDCSGASAACRMPPSPLES